MAIGALLSGVLGKAGGPEKLVWKIPAIRPSSLSPHFDWAKLADDFLWVWYNHPDRRAHRPRGIFHPSAGLHWETGACKRAIVFELLYAPMSPTRITPMLAKILENGTNRHVGLQKLFKDMADNGYMGMVSAKSEVIATHYRLPLLGHADEVVQMRDGHQYLYDFKTASSKVCETLYEPKVQHRVQINTYAGILNIRTMYMIYENKDNQKWIGPMERMRIEFDPRLYAETEEFCLETLRIVNSEQLPEYSEKVCKDNITFCWYKNICDKCKAGTVNWEDVDKRPETVKRKHLEVL